MKINLEGKFALITGSSEGIGFNIAKTLQDNGCEVVINGRNKSKLNLASKKLNNCISIKGDVTNYKEAHKIVQKYKRHYNRLDILVCNVGNGKKINKIADINEWHKSFDNNFWSSINIIKCAEKILIKSKSSIICISSICGLEHIYVAPIPYSVAKSALNSFVVNQSKFFGKFKTRINAIAPGNIIFQGSTWLKKMKKSPLKTQRYINQNVPLKLFGKPDDVSSMVLYLSSDKTKYITGSIFKIDGGQVSSW